MEQDDFRALLLEQLDAVHRLAYHLTFSVNEADDLVQETFLRALKSRGSFRATERGPRPWLFKILHNVYRTRLGKSGRVKIDGEAIDDQAVAAPDIPPPGLDWEQVDERLKRAMEALPRNQQTVILLWAVEGLTYQQIADVLETPIGTVMSRLYRARQTLIEKVADLAIERRLAGPGRAAADARSDGITPDPADKNSPEETRR